MRLFKFNKVYLSPPKKEKSCIVFVYYKSPGFAPHLHPTLRENKERVLNAGNILSKDKRAKTQSVLMTRQLLHWSNWMCLPYLDMSWYCRIRLAESLVAIIG